MNGLRVRVVSGGEAHYAELPATVPMARLLPLLLERLQLPFRAPDGSSLWGIFVRGRQLGNEETLEAAGVTSEETLELKPRIQIDLSDRRFDTVLPLLTKLIQLEPASVPIPLVEDQGRLGFHFAHFALRSERSERQVRVSLWDLISICIRPSVQLPADVEMRRLLPALAEAIGVKLHIDSVDVRYELRLKSGKVLRDGETLSQVGIEPGDTLFFLLTENRDQLAATPGWTCGSCARPCAEEWPFCPACGAVNPTFCISCSQRIPEYPNILFCPSCGKRLS